MKNKKKFRKVRNSIDKEDILYLFTYSTLFFLGGIAMYLTDQLFVYLMGALFGIPVFLLLMDFLFAEVYYEEIELNEENKR